MPDTRLMDLTRRTMLCPRCEEEQPLREFSPLGLVPTYREQLVTIYRCKLCNHLFAPKSEASRG